MSEAFFSFRDARHVEKFPYIGAHDKFYESSYDSYQPSCELRDIVDAVLRGGAVEYTAVVENVWTHILYEGSRGAASKLLEQGWKIHISANNINCKDILRIAVEVVARHSHQFKFANDIETLRLMTSKRWQRGGSGKFITIYPPSEEQFKDVLEDLYAALNGYGGSYILSDRRYKDSRCIYYRYGGIKPRQRMNIFGRMENVITTPDGEEMLDERTPFFDPPEWVRDPFPDDENEEESEMTLDSGRYEINEALKFSNTGGVYLATDTTTGQQVIIKEARPGVELSMDGSDATDRLAQEAKMLSLLKGTEVVPEFMRTFWDWENFYLVEEYFKSIDMRGIMLSHTPLFKIEPTIKQSANFYGICKKIFTGILSAVQAFHDKGVVIGDLSPTNIMVEEESWIVKIIDLEGAYRPGIDAEQSIHTPGFRLYVKGRELESEFSDDLYAIGMTILYSIFPLSALAYLRDDYIQNVAPVIVNDVGWSQTPILEIAKGLVDNTLSCADAIELLEQDVVLEQPSYVSGVRKPLPSINQAAIDIGEFIKANHREESKFTLFPNDPFARLTNPLGFAFGSTGVVYSFDQCGFLLPESARRRFDADLNKLEPERLAPGFLTGSSGMALALFAMGRHSLAQRYLDAANSSPLSQSHHSLYYGMAGIGLANLAGYRYTNERHMLNAAIQYGTKLENLAIRDEQGVFWTDVGSVKLGYGYGQSGVALFLLRLSQLTGDYKWRELGQEALKFDLACALELDTGVVAFPETPINDEESSSTASHYIEVGTAGIAKAAVRYGMWDNLNDLLHDCQRKYSGHAGLLYGVTSFLDVLTDAYNYSQDRKYLEMAERPLRGLFDLYLFKAKEGLAAPGDGLFRISCDYGTGLSGIMLALTRYQKQLPDELCLDWVDCFA